MSWIVLFLENLLFPLGALAIVFRFLFSSRRRVLMSLGDELSERFGNLSEETLAKLAGKPVLWVHAASAGEVAAVSRILERIRQRTVPGDSSKSLAPAILMTCTTVTGREKAKTLSCVDAAVLAPLDFFPAVSRFLASARPKTLLIVETELWPQTIALARARGVKIALVNGRMTGRSFSRYRIVGGLVSPFLNKIDKLALQTEAYADRFRALGAPRDRIAVVGNMKYDSLKAAPRDAAVERYLDALGWDGGPVLVAGSTHKGEEEDILEAYRELKSRFPKLHLVMAPRHPERVKETEEAFDTVNVSYCLWSQGPAPAEALLIDGLGVLPKLYPFAALAFVGGTLAPVGGHNLLEPAMAGAPVLFGPHVDHTAEVARLLESAGCGFTVTDPASLAALAGDLLGDEQRRKALGALAQKTARGLAGAVDRTLAHVHDLLP